MLLQECHGVCCRRGRRRTKLLEEQSEGGERIRVSCILGNLRAFCMPLQRGVAISTEHSTKPSTSTMPLQYSTATPHNTASLQMPKALRKQRCTRLLLKASEQHDAQLFFVLCVFFGSANKGQPTGDFNRKTLVILV